MNLNYRTNNGLIQAFNVNNLNELTGGSRSGTLTVGGATSRAATNVTVNGVTAVLYSDSTFAKDGFTLADGTNSFTAIAQDPQLNRATNTVTAFLPVNPSFQYDTHGNLTNDGQRVFYYDDENELIAVQVTNAWRSEFQYDGLMRRRVRRIRGQTIYFSDSGFTFWLGSSRSLASCRANCECNIPAPCITS